MFITISMHFKFRNSCLFVLTENIAFLKNNIMYTRLQREFARTTDFGVIFNES